MIRLLAVLFLCLIALPASSQSFDCAAATTSIELAICSDSNLAELDEALTESFLGIRDMLPAEHRENATAIQRLWLRSRDARCEDHAYSVTWCLTDVYRQWLRLGESGILHAEEALEDGEWHVSPLVDDWRFHYVEIDEEAENLERRYSSELSLYIDGQKYQLAYFDDNKVYGAISYVRTRPDSIGYFLTPSGHVHVGFVQHEEADGGTCGGYGRSEFVFLNRHVRPPTGDSSICGEGRQ